MQTLEALRGPEEVCSSSFRIWIVGEGLTSSKKRKSKAKLSKIGKLEKIKCKNWCKT